MSDGMCAAPTLSLLNLLATRSRYQTRSLDDMEYIRLRGAPSLPHDAILPLRIAASWLTAFLLIDTRTSKRVSLLLLGPTPPKMTPMCSR